LDPTEVGEPDRPPGLFGELPAGPGGCRANILRSASGRAYLAFCPGAERQAVLRRLRDRDVAGHELAHDAAAVRRMVTATRRRGYSGRAPDFGGPFSKIPRGGHDRGNTDP